MRNNPHVVNKRSRVLKIKTTLKNTTLIWTLTTWKVFVLHIYFLRYLQQIKFILLQWSKWPCIHQQHIQWVSQHFLQTRNRTDSSILELFLSMQALSDIRTGTPEVLFWPLPMCKSHYEVFTLLVPCLMTAEKQRLCSILCMAELHFQSRELSKKI